MSESAIITRAERAARRRGLGDIVSSIATPIAATLHLPCVDPATKQLRPESPCAKRKADWNAATDKARDVLNGLLGRKVDQSQNAAPPSDTETTPSTEPRPQ